MSRYRILFTGVGGQGTLLASRLLGEAAMACGEEVVVSEVHGMAQRGGVVESTVMLGGIKGPIISAGQADVLVSFEPLETLRALNRCSHQSTIVTNTTSVIPFTVELGAAKYPDMDVWLGFMRENFKQVYALDAESLAKEAGTAKALNIVLLGVLFGAGLIPFDSDVMVETIKARVKPKFVDANLKAFSLGMEAAGNEQ